MTGRVRRRRRETTGLAGPRAKKTVSLALQGGGPTAPSRGRAQCTPRRRAPRRGSDHGCERRCHERCRIGGGLDRGRDRRGTEPARNLLAQRDAIDALIDFDRVRAATYVEIFISATNAWTGKGAIFRKAELTADHLMASACIPTVFQAVEIDGVPYWDGGYTGNPALYPLCYESMTDDIVLVQINPLERRQTPRSMREIHNRLDEITFNGTLLRELRAVVFVQRLIKKGKLSPKEYKDVHLHRIDASGVLDDFEAPSRLNAEWEFFEKLRDAGRQAAQAWLAEHYEAIGVRTTIDLESVLR
jgi:predicted acylesterase/phospholipase RssA